MSARVEELLPGQALEPLAVPVPELPPVDPNSLLRHLDSVSMVRVNISEDGSVNIAPIAESGRDSLCDATSGSAIWAPLSRIGAMHFDASLGLC